MAADTTDTVWSMGGHGNVGGGGGGGVWRVGLQFFHFSLTDLTATDFDDALRPHWNRTFIRDGRKGGEFGNESPRAPSTSHSL